MAEISEQFLFKSARDPCARRDLISSGTVKTLPSLTHCAGSLRRRCSRIWPDWKVKPVRQKYRKVQHARFFRCLHVPPSPHPAAPPTHTADAFCPAHSCCCHDPGWSPRPAVGHGRFFFIFDSILFFFCCISPCAADILCANGIRGGRHHWHADFTSHLQWGWLPRRVMLVLHAGAFEHTPTAAPHPPIHALAARHRSVRHRLQHACWLLCHQQWHVHCHGRHHPVKLACTATHTHRDHRQLSRRGLQHHYSRQQVRCATSSSHRANQTTSFSLQHHCHRHH